MHPGADEDAIIPFLSPEAYVWLSVLSHARTKPSACMGGLSLPELLSGSQEDSAGTGGQPVQRCATCTGIELVQVSTASLGPHSHYRELWIGQGCAARMETANSMRNTARMGTQLARGHMQGDSVES